MHIDHIEIAWNSRLTNSPDSSFLRVATCKLLGPSPELCLASAWAISANSASSCVSGCRAPKNGSIHVTARDHVQERMVSDMFFCYKMLSTIFKSDFWWSFPKKIHQPWPFCPTNPARPKKPSSADASSSGAAAMASSLETRLCQTWSWNSQSSCGGRLCPAIQKFWHIQFRQI